MTNRQILVAGVIGALAIAAPAAAETKSWAALKGKLPAATVGVVSIDVKALRGAATYKDLLAAVFSIGGLGDVKQGIDMVKSTCGVDVTSAISDVTLAITPKDRDMLAAFGLDGLDEAKIVDCVTKIASGKAPGAKVTSKASGAGKEYTIIAGRSTDLLYVAWPSKDVFVIGGKPNNSTSLDGYAAGKAAAGDLAAFIAKGSAIAAPLAWVAGIDPGSKEGIKGGYGAVTLAKGMITMTGRLVTLDAARGKALHDEAMKDWKKSIDKVPPELQKVMKAVRLANTGADITVDATMPEADLPKALPALIKGF